MPLAAADFTSQVDEAFYWIGGISLALLVGVTLAMVYFVVRYSRKRHRTPAQIESHWGLELTWIIVPTILVLVMFWKGYEGFLNMREVPPGAMVIDVTGRQWSWTFEYPEQGLTTSRLYLPADTDVRFNLHAPADDVTHSFYLPDYRVKEDCVPGRVNHMWIHTRGPGVHNIFCAEFCGKDHAKMITELEVLPKEGFTSWVRARIADRYKPIDLTTATDPDSEEIRARDAGRLYKTYCASCHGPEGRGGLVEGARDFTSLSGWKKSPRLSDIFRTLTEGLPGTQMRSFAQLPPWDRFALAHRVRSFHQGAGLPADTPEQLADLVAHYELDKIKPPAERLPIEKAMEILAEEAR